MTAPTGRYALVYGPGSSTLIDALRLLGWAPADPDATTPVDLLVIAPAPQDDGDEWSAAAAMDATAEVILGITERRERLRAGRGLVVVAVATPPGRAAVRLAGDGVVSAALAMSVQLLAVDWAPDGVRCLLVVTGGDGSEALARLVHWLAAPDAPTLSGQTIDMAAVEHATLRAPGA